MQYAFNTKTSGAGDSGSSFEADGPSGSQNTGREGDAEEPINVENYLPAPDPDDVTPPDTPNSSSKRNTPKSTGKNTTSLISQVSLTSN